MIKIIRTKNDDLLKFVKDDPVRPEISDEFRIDSGRFVLMSLDEMAPAAIVCVSFHDFVPESVSDLHILCSIPTIAVMYTIWSYKPGAGKSLLINSIPLIKKEYPSVYRYLTLSPKTELARNFHLKNGATIFRENQDTINYEYLQK